jgi:hypothetical protein
MWCRSSGWAVWLGLAWLGRDIASERVTYEQNVLFFVDHPRSHCPIVLCFCVVHVRVVIVLAAS